MSARGHSLRFLGRVLGGWIMFRGATALMPLLWASWTPPPPPLPQPQVGRAELAPPVSDGAEIGPGTDRLAQPVISRGSRTMRPSGAVAVATADVAPVFPITPVPGTAGIPGSSQGDSALPVPPPSGRSGDRWSGSAWLLWWPASPSGGGVAPLLGGSQLGGRIDLRLTGRLSAYGRLSRALVGRGAEEGALGLAWRPAGVPAAVMIERRQRLGEGGRNGFALLVAGGISDREVAPGVRLDSYAQAGVVGVDDPAGFADGRLGLAGRLGPAVSVGAAVYGSAQPGVARLDAGPELRARLGAMTVAAGWRARLAGTARPANGPVVTMFADF